VTASAGFFADSLNRSLANSVFQSIAAIGAAAGDPFRYHGSEDFGAGMPRYCRKSLLAMSEKCGVLFREAQ
jgi:hypothetical protein